MGKMKIYTSRNDKFFCRILKFSEVEITYSNADFMMPIEIDLKSREHFAHLQVTEESAEMTVVEGMNWPSGSSKQVKVRETVFFIEFKGERFHHSQLKEMVKCMTEDEDRGENEKNGKLTDLNKGYER